MTAFSIASSARRFATAIMMTTVVGGCAPDELLSIQDPDIVNPSDVQSAAGANAVRLGALARLGTSTSGAESLLLLGGLFSDEWNNGDSFIARQEIDQRVITPQNNFLTDANRALHRARLSAEQAIKLLEQYAPASPAWQRAEMYFVRAYVMNLMAEHLCSGMVFSSVDLAGVESYGTPATTTAAFTQALQHADDGLRLVTGTTAQDVKVRNALQVIRGRILMNLNRPADAATAVAGVPTAFRYDMLHALTVTSNQVWAFNNSARRYSVSTGEGSNGLNFATANDPRIPICQGGDAACRLIGVTNTSRDDLTRPYYVQMIWPDATQPVTITSGIEARMLEAEAQLRAGNTGPSLATLNAARTTVTGLTPLTDAGTTDARVNQLFRERAFWLFARGYRTGDLRRLVRQYSRPANTVFPVGTWHKGGNYGGDVTLPLPLAEANNPNIGAGGGCLDRNP